jgi:outer membrane receptor protein involved in Fe transport
MGGRPPAWPVAALIVAAGFVSPGAAHAGETTFDIPLQARESALLAFARQADLSLGFAPDARCGGRAGVTGRLSADAALSRLIAGSGCVASRPDARTVVIRSRPASASSARAEPVDTRPPPSVLSELVVTADKTEQLLSSSASALTAIGASQLRSAVGTHDLSLLAAGVTVTNLGPGRDKIILRGLSDGPLTGHTQSTVGLYLGDLRLTYNAPDPDLPLIDIARVEVLRGPQGSLYGAGSIGGVVHIVPQAPDPAARGGLASATISSTAHGATSHSLQGVLNQPLAPDLAVRVAAWSETAGGYIDDLARGLSDVDRTRRRGARAAILWRASPDLELEATFVDQNIDTRDAHYAQPTARLLSRSSSVAQPHDNDFMALALGARWTPAWGQLSFSLGALDHDVGTTYAAAGAPPSLAPTGLAARIFQDRNEIRALVGESRAASTGPGPLQWKAGLFASAGDQRLEGRIKADGGAVGYAELRRDRLLETAAFGEVSFDLTSQLTFSAGGRLFNSRLKTRSDITLNGPVRSFRGRSTDQGFAPKLVAAYRPRPGLTLYLQAAEGYRTTGFNTSGGADQTFSVTGSPQPLRRYAGDELWNYELGGRWRSADLGISLRAAVFQASWTDIQADLVLPSGLPFTANLGDGRSRGVEVEATYLRGGLELSANLVRQDPELRRPAPGLPSRADTGLPGVPDISVVVSGSYSWALPRDGTFGMRVTYAYVGRSKLAFDAVTAPSMGGYGDLRVAATARLGSVTARLFAENLLDRRGDTLAFGNPFTFRSQAASTPQRPRTFGITLSRSF